MNYKASIAIILTFLLSGCFPETDKIEMTKIDNETYLINHKENRAFLVQGDKIIPLSEIQFSDLNINKLISGQQTISNGNLNVAYKFKVLESEVLYQLVLRPNLNIDETGASPETPESIMTWIEKLIQDDNPNHRLHFSLTDIDGFEIIDNEIQIRSGFVRILGNDGKPQAYSYEGSIKISREKSPLLNSAAILWNF